MICCCCRRPAPVLCCAPADLIGVRQTQTMHPTIPMASLMKLATVTATTTAAAEAGQESLGQDRPRPSRPRLAQAKSVAVEKQRLALGETEAGSGEPPIAPPRARKRQSMPFVRRANANELAAAATPIAKPPSECPPPPQSEPEPRPSDSIAEIDCLAKSAESSDGPPAASDEIKVAPETVRADSVLADESHESATRQPLASSTSAGALSSLFTKLFGKLPHDLRLSYGFHHVVYGQR